MPTNVPDERVELLHPFYLDTEMSMAFAAALAGGVALEREEVEGDKNESQAVRNLRGNLRLFGVGGVDAGGEQTKVEAAATASRLVRRHTEASIFIALYDELRRSGRVVEDIDVSTLRAGNIVSIEIGPAVAPLRRIVDQIIRLLDVAAPLQDEPDAALTGSTPSTRQQRRQQAREAAKTAASAGARGGDDEDDGLRLAQIRALFVALQDDLDQSGMVDVVVHREAAPSVVLTLDKRLASDQAIEMLHTSRFTVIGKVTQIWPTEDDVANLYRRSVMSLVPALAQTVGWGMFIFLAGFAGALDVKAIEKAAYAAAGVDEESGAADQEESQQILMSDDAIAALTPAVQGPAIQIIPLAICA